MQKFATKEACKVHLLQEEWRIPTVCCSGTVVLHEICGYQKHWSLHLQGTINFQGDHTSRKNIDWGVDHVQDSANLALKESTEAPNVCLLWIQIYIQFMSRGSLSCQKKFNLSFGSMGKQIWIWLWLPTIEMHYKVMQLVQGIYGTPTCLKDHTECNNNTNSMLAFQLKVRLICRWLSVCPFVNNSALMKNQKSEGIFVCLICALESRGISNWGQTTFLHYHIQLLVWFLFHLLFQSNFVPSICLLSFCHSF